MIIVAGIARSGLTVTMQMLYAGGYPCVGEWPAFEAHGIGEVPWFSCAGKAVKLVDAHLQLPNEHLPVEYSVIRLHRDARQQAESNKKFARALLGSAFARVSTKRLEKSFALDYAVIDRWADKRRVLHLHFEDIINKPGESARKIAEFSGKPLDVQKMAACVVKRGTDCHPTLLELEMLR